MINVFKKMSKVSDDTSKVSKSDRIVEVKRRRESLESSVGSSKSILQSKSVVS